jgi:hypothetical protein
MEQMQRPAWHCPLTHGRLQPTCGHTMSFWGQRSTPLVKPRPGSAF